MSRCPADLRDKTQIHKSPQLRNISPTHDTDTQTHKHADIFSRI